MFNSIAKTFPVAALIFILAGCSTTSHAPVIERSSNSTHMTYATSNVPAATPADSTVYHTVKKGETLYSIALQHGQDYRDIANWNNIDNPSALKVDQVLRVSPLGATNSNNINNGTVAIAQPIPATGSGVQEKSLDSATALPPLVTTNAASNAVSGASTSAIKSGPLGEKRPYSDATLAELSKPDSSSNPVPTKPLVIEQPKPETVAPVTPEPAKAEDKEDAAIGWIWPAPGKVIAEFSENGSKGIDIAGKAGDPVIASADGKVVYAGSGLRGYGNLVIVKHNNNFLSAYAHNRTLLVKEQQIVKKGQKIAEMGNSDTDQNKLHFEIRNQGKPVDPLKYLPAR